MTHSRHVPGVRVRGLVLGLSLAMVTAGCGDILDVENPNNLSQDDLSNPAAAGPIVNGASATVARGLGAMLGVYSTVSDEATWIGSRDAFRELDQGFVSNERNEFTDDAYRYFSQARFMADEAVKRVEAFDAEKTLPDRNSLAQAYLYAAIAYVTAADMYDTFVISDRRDAGTPIPGPEMVKLYDQAIAYLSKGLTVAEATKNTSLQHALLGMRARAEFSKGVWGKVNPEGQTPSQPLVSSAAASRDAQAALAIMPADYRFVMTLSNDDLAYAGEVSLAYSINQRGELAIAPDYGTGGKAAAATLQDPIDKIADPALDRAIKAFAAASVNQPITVVSAREMHLILAEGALASGDVAGFTTHINRLRALDKLTPFSGQIAPLDLLQHERRVNLFFQGRRLADHYRFATPSAQWIAGSTALTRAGTFFPVTCIEIRAHPADFPGISC